MTSPEGQIEEKLIEKLVSLKYEYRTDIRDRATLEKNFREKFEALNRVRLTEGEFQRLLEEIITPDVFAAARTLRERNSFNRDDGTPLNYTLVNIKDWCKNTFEVVNQLRINTDNSHHRYDVILLINGVPAVQIELKTLGISPRRAMEQIVDYKNDPGNGYTRTLLCFLQLFIVSNRSETWYFANNNSRHFSFNAEERFLPVYQFAAEDNKKITHLDSFAEAFLPKCTLGQMISRYMVLIASEQKLMMMRPYPFYKVSDISNSLQAGKVFIDESANYINESLLKQLKAKPIPEGTTIFAKIGEAIRSNRRAITTKPCLIDNNAAGVKSIRGRATDLFVYLLMETIALIDYSGGVVPAVNKSAIEEIEVKFPEIDEQRKITDCLFSLDESIFAQTQKLDALKTHKKGLMQQLFPYPEEVEA